MANVVGAGVGGLAIAIRLAAMGYDVRIFDANPFAGGKLSEITLGKYRFDAGPSLFTMPHLVEELYWLSGQTSSGFPYRRLEEICRYFFPDGTRFRASGRPEILAKTLAQMLGENQETIEHYLKQSKLKYDTIGSLFLEKCLRKISTFLGARARKAYVHLMKLGLFESLHQLNARQFRNPKTVQLFDRYATYNGSDPYQTSAVMSMIPHLEMGIGAFFPQEGMIQITQSLVELAQKSGVRFFLGKEVNNIMVHPTRGASGIEAGGETYLSDLVVSAIDVEKTYQLFNKNLPKPLPYQVLPKSTSAIIFYWGVKGKFPELGLHNIFFSQDYQKEFHALFQTKTMPDDPTIYLNISAKEKATDSPEGCENWFVMVNAPANEGQPWDQWVSQTRAVVLARLKKELGIELDSLIEEETFLDPVSLEKRTGAVGGALYGSNSNDRMAAFLRHANFSNQVPHLYFCGGTVHPGGGIPLALQSAAIACDYIRQREK